MKKNPLHHRIAPGTRVRWDRFNTAECGDVTAKDARIADTERIVAQLDPLQERLYAEGRRSLLVILQAIDTGGKDGVIRHVMRSLNPQGCVVTSFKVPTPEERNHDFLWRVHKAVPAKGMIAVFNRSHYEDVLVTRVHGLITPADAKRRMHHINEFERLLVDSGTTVLKFFLAISKDEQRRRLQARLDDPHKRWKFSPNDLIERKSWTRYAAANAEVLSATSTTHAPWHLIPADHKWYRNYVVARTMLDTLKGMDPKFPPAPRGVDFTTIRIPR
jgi:PPK2 family polyphosphate:nucleotide phosphotransferase